VIKLLSSFPTSIFTGVLAFCLTWWIITTIISGIDADSDGGGHGHIGAGHGHAGHAGHASHAGPHHTGHSHAGQHHAGQHHGSHGGHGGSQEHHYVSDAFAVGFVPLPLALTILAFGGWAVSLVLQYVLGDSSTARLTAAVGTVVLIASLSSGFLLLRSLRRPVSKLFETEFAPDRHQAVGSTCKVRTLVVTDRLGDAEVLTGPTKGSLIRVRADEGRFSRGDVAVIIDYDQQTEAFVIDDLDEMLRPG